MKNKKKLIGFVSIIMLCTLNYIVFQIMLEHTIDLVEVSVVKETLYPRDKIEKEDLMTIEVPRLYVHDGIYTSESDVIGKYLDIQSTLPKGSFLYKEILFNEEDLPDYPAMLLKDEQVAYSLSTDLKEMAGNTIVVGQKVDIYVSIAIRNEKPVVDYLLKGVRVVGVKDRKGLDLKNPESTKIPYVVVLAIDEMYIPYMESAQEVGEISLMAIATNYDDNYDCELNEESKVIPYIAYDE